VTMRPSGNIGRTDAERKMEEGKEKEDGEGKDWKKKVEREKKGKGKGEKNGR